MDLVWVSCLGFLKFLIQDIFSSGFESGGDFYLGTMHSCLVHFKMEEHNAAFLVKR